MGGGFTFFSVVVAVVLLVLAQCIGKGAGNAHQDYTQFLLANGVARTPPMGYSFSSFDLVESNFVVC